MKHIIILCLLITSTSTYADVLPTMNSKGGAMVLPEGKLKLDIKSLHFKRNSMFDGSNEVQNKENLDAKANAFVIGLGYGLSNDTLISLAIPYKNLEATAKLGKEGVAIHNKGFGDIGFAIRYIFLPMKEYGFQLAFDAGVKIPTGSKNDGFKIAPTFATGINTPMPTQMGTGGFEYKAGIGLSKMINDHWRIDSNLAYTYRPTAHNEYEFGNETNFVLGTTKSIHDNINIGIDYNFTHNSKTNMGTDTNPTLRKMLPFKAFSGMSGYITPQLEFLPFGKAKLHIGIGMSFLAHYNVSEYQPLEKRRYLLTVGYLF